MHYCTTPELKTRRFLGQFLRPVKKLEAKLGGAFCIGTFPETLTRNHHLLLSESK